MVCFLGLCKWTGCESRVEDTADFIKHIQVDQYKRHVDQYKRHVDKGVNR